MMERQVKTAAVPPRNMRGAEGMERDLRHQYTDAFMVIGDTEPRVAFMEELLRIADSDERVVALDVDTSRRTPSYRFRDKYPDRFWNMGVAEQNMLGVAAGLAAAGRRPFAFAFAIFASMRALEILRTSICYPRLNVTIVGGYAGLTNGKDGATHQSIEDVGILRCIPNLVVMSPSDATTARKIAHAAYEHEGPVYVRIEYESSPEMHDPTMPFEIGRGFRLREGRDVTLAGYGSAVARIMSAARLLDAEGIDAEVLDLPTLKPLDHDLLCASVSKTRALLTLEDHNVIGGLASAACQVLVERRLLPRFRSLAVQDVFTESGKTSDLRAKHGLGIEAVVRAARDLIAQP
jgi:transketolase